ncbi:MAG: hypothetical protein ACOC44_15925 [Promethearchaeia archaeon]
MIVVVLVSMLGILAITLLAIKHKKNESRSKRQKDLAHNPKRRPKKKN